MRMLCLLQIATVAGLIFTHDAAAACLETDPPQPCRDVIIPWPRQTGELVGWIDLNNQIVIRPIGNQTIFTEGLGLTSQAHHLVPASRAAPFRFFLENTPHQVVYGDLKAHRIPAEGITLSGYDLESALQAGVTPCHDLDDQASIIQTQSGFCTLAGDVNFDGAVTFVDFLTLSHHFGKQDAVWPDGDFDWDREVGFADFLLLADNYGSALGANLAHAVPEPHSGSTLLCVMVICLAIRRPGGCFRPGTAATR